MDNTIEFKGPFNINHLDKGLEQELDKPGIYIWGFKFYKNSDGSIGEPIDFNNLNENKKQIFLPYYVGKIEGKLINRLNTHKKVTEGHAAKYTRVSSDYIKKFFNDEKFQINDGKKINIENIKSNTGIEYYNNPDFLKHKINKENTIDLNNIISIGEDKNNNPITKFKSLNDNLDELINKKDNFWFCYGIVKNEDGLFSCYLENFETLTFYSLKGKTISKTGNFDNLLEEIFLIDKTEVSIFKEKKVSKKIIKEKYLDKKNEVEFPGY
jgi:hypothetical protein